MSLRELAKAVADAESEWKQSWRGGVAGSTPEVEEQRLDAYSKLQSAERALIAAAMKVPPDMDGLLAEYDDLVERYMQCAAERDHYRDLLHRVQAQVAEMSASLTKNRAA